MSWKRILPLGLGGLVVLLALIQAAPYGAGTARRRAPSPSAPASTATAT